MCRRGVFTSPLSNSAFLNCWKPYFCVFYVCIFDCNLSYNSYSFICFISLRFAAALRKSRGVSGNSTLWYCLSLFLTSINKSTTFLRPSVGLICTRGYPTAFYTPSLTKVLPFAIRLASTGITVLLPSPRIAGGLVLVSTLLIIMYDGRLLWFRTLFIRAIRWPSRSWRDWGGRGRGPLPKTWVFWFLDLILIANYYGVP